MDDDKKDTALGLATKMRRTAFPKSTMQQGRLQRGDGCPKAAADDEEDAPGMAPGSRSQKGSRGDRFLFQRPGWRIIFKKTNDIVH